MAKHTQGPWAVGPDIIGAIGPNGFTRHIVTKITPARLKKQKVDPAQVAADYRLIAAAPDLLAALQKMTDKFEGCYADGDPAFVAAKAAIAKATLP